MRRGLGTAVGVLVVAAAGSAIAWFWISARPRVQPSSVGPAAASSSPAAPGGAAAAPAAEMVLQLNGETSARVSTGTPAFFTVSLTGTSPQPALRLGGPGRAWSAAVQFETAQGGSLPFRVEPLGRPVTYPVGDGGRAADKELRATAADEAIVDASRIHRAQFGISPDEAAKIPAGAHGIRAVVRPEGQAQPAFISNAVTLTIEPLPGDAAQLAAAERARLVASARFHLRAARWEEAHRLALQLVERPDRDVVAYMLLADALNGLRRDEEALAAYEEALAALPANSGESPDYLLARVDEVRERLEAAARKAAK